VRYHKISHNPVAIKNLLVDLSWWPMSAPKQIVLDLARRLRLRAGGPDGLVRGQQRRFPVRAGGNVRLVAEIASELDGVA
jgi:hypothetical protein